MRKQTNKQTTEVVRLEGKKRDIWGQKDSRRGQEVARMRWMRGRLRARSALQLPLWWFQQRGFFLCFLFLFCLHQHPKRSTLFTSQTTATHSRWLQGRGAVGVNSSTHNPLPPPWWKLSVHVPVGTAAVFLMPAPEVAWECSLFLGQGTYSTEGLHLGAQRRWGLTLSLFLILGCGSAWWIKQIARAKLLVSLQCLPVAPRRQEILEKIEDSKGFWKGKQSAVWKLRRVQTPPPKKTGLTQQPVLTGLWCVGAAYCTYHLRLICNWKQMKQSMHCLYFRHLLLQSSSLGNRNRSLALACWCFVAQDKPKRTFWKKKKSQNVSISLDSETVVKQDRLPNDRCSGLALEDSMRWNSDNGRNLGPCFPYIRIFTAARHKLLFPFLALPSPCHGLHAPYISLHTSCTCALFLSHLLNKFINSHKFIFNM